MWRCGFSVADIWKRRVVDWKQGGEMVKFLFLLICTVFLNIGQVRADTLELVSLEQPPLVFQQDGVVKGISVDIVKEVFRRIKQPVNISIYPFARTLALMQSGKVDGLFAVVKTAEREKYMDYCEEILIEQTGSLFVRADSKLDFDGDLSKLAELNVGVLRGATYGAQWEKAVQAGTFHKLEAVGDYRMNLHKLMVGRLDVMVGPYFTIMNLIEQEGLNGQVVQLNPPIELVPTYLTFARSRKLDKLKKQVDQALEEMRLQGTMDHITSRYLGS